MREQISGLLWDEETGHVTRGEILGYPVPSSVLPGATIDLHVSCPYPKFRAKFYRQGATLQLVYTSGAFNGVHTPLKSASDDFNWTSYSFAVPLNWTSGAYIVLFEGLDASGNLVAAAPTLPVLPDGRQVPFSPDRSLLFVVRNPTPGSGPKILMRLPLANYHAYNVLGASSLYSTYDVPPRVLVTPTVSMRRPGGGVGGPSDDATVDLYDPLSPYDSFAHWDAKMIQWLESSGWSVDYCTDIDLHSNPGDFLGLGNPTPNYKLALSCGHEEYWSPEMVQNLKTFRDHGGNVAFLSGNTCYRRVTIVPDVSITCFKNLWSNSERWCNDTDPNNHENRLTGVRFDGTGLYRPANELGIGFTVQQANDPLYTGVGITNGVPTGLSTGNIFGAHQAPVGGAPPKGGIIGCEADGAEVMLSGGVYVPTGNDGTPLTFKVLGYAPFPIGGGFDGSFGGPATMGYYQQGGIVFTGATLDWARVITQDVAVQKITSNLLNWLT